MYGSIQQRSYYSTAYERRYLIAQLADRLRQEAATGDHDIHKSGQAEYNGSPNTARPVFSLYNLYSVDYIATHKSNRPLTHAFSF